jgi:hypothetical protein
MMNQEGYGKKMSWSVLRYYISICMEQMMKPQKARDRIAGLW